MTAAVCETAITWPVAFQNVGLGLCAVAGIFLVLRFFKTIMVD